MASEAKTQEIVLMPKRLTKLFAPPAASLLKVEAFGQSRNFRPALTDIGQGSPSALPYPSSARATMPAERDREPGAIMTLQRTKKLRLFRHSMSVLAVTTAAVIYRAPLSL